MSTSPGHELLSDSSSLSNTEGGSVRTSSTDTKPLIPQEILVQPEPSPYVQLCFSRQSLVAGNQPRMIAVLVGSSKYSRLEESEIPGLQFVTSYSSSSSSSSFEESSSGWSSCSSASSSLTSETTKVVHCQQAHPGQDIVWLDEAWLFDSSSMCSDRALLRADDSSDDDYSGDSSRCGKLIRTVAFCNAPKQREYHRGGGNAGGHRDFLRRLAGHPKRQTYGKKYGYSMLQG